MPNKINVIFVTLSILFLAQEKSFAEDLDYGHEPGFALGLSVLATTLPVLAGTQIISSGSNSDFTSAAAFLILAGLFLGPSTGQFYARAPEHAFLGFGIRSAGAAIALVGFVNSITLFDSPKPKNQNQWLTVSLIGVLTYAGGVIYSLCDSYAQGAALQEHRRNKRNFGVSPTLQITPAASEPFTKPATLAPSLSTGAVAWMSF